MSNKSTSKKLYESDRYQFLPHRSLRHVIQLISFILLNGGLIGLSITWLLLPINQPPTTHSVVDGALYIGTTMMINGLVPFIAIATFLLVGAVIGRGLCAYVCPVGFIQDILAYLPPKHKFRPSKNSNESFTDMAKIIAIVIIIFAILIGFTNLTGSNTDRQNISETFGAFAKDPFSVIDPYATLMAYFPYIILDVDWSGYMDFDSIIGIDIFFWFRLLVFFIVFLVVIFIPRAYCRYFCPTGAILGFIGKDSAVGLHRNIARCNNCGDCEAVCPMGVRILDYGQRVNDFMCINCGDCVSICEPGALEIKLKVKE